MRIYTLSCFQYFACLASTCPDTCCQNWEVMLDAKTCARYRAMPGDLGDQLRAAICEKDGETFFELKGGYCPFLNPEKLCRIQLQEGVQALSINCDAYPRFIEVYGGDQEQCLAISCPEAARLLLANEMPMQLLETQNGAWPEPNDLDAIRYRILKAARKVAISIVQDRTLPIARRLAVLLHYTEQLQTLLRKRDLEAAEMLRQQYLKTRRQIAETLPTDQRTRTRLLKHTMTLFSQMEPLQPAWEAQLQEAQIAMEAAGLRATKIPAWQYEHILVYFLYRYFLKAVNDGKLLARVRGIVLMYLLLRMLETEEDMTCCMLETRLYRFSREIEHSTDNLNLLWKEAANRRFSNLIAAL